MSDIYDDLQVWKILANRRPRKSRCAINHTLSLHNYQIIYLRYQAIPDTHRYLFISYKLKNIMVDHHKACVRMLQQGRKDFIKLVDLSRQFGCFPLLTPPQVERFIRQVRYARTEDIQVVVWHYSLISLRDQGAHGLLDRPLAHGYRRVQPEAMA